jgi:hypothetical protein
MKILVGRLPLGGPRPFPQRSHECDALLDQQRNAFGAFQLA